MICNQSYLSWRFTHRFFAGDTRTTLGCSAEQEIQCIIYPWIHPPLLLAPNLGHRTSEPARSPSHSFPASSSAWCVPLAVSPPRYGPGNMSPRRIPLFICRLWQQASSLSRPHPHLRVPILAKTCQRPKRRRSPSIYEASVNRRPTTISPDSESRRAWQRPLSTSASNRFQSCCIMCAFAVGE